MESIKAKLADLHGNAKFDVAFDCLSKKLGSIKRHLMASPFEMML